MSYSSNYKNMSGGSSTHLNGEAGSGADSSDLKRSLGSSSVLKELHSNESNSKLGPLSPKAALNNSKTAAGSAFLTVSENNSENEYENHQHVAKDQMDNSGVNKSSNKFIGLAEFDESKIPELPDDLNPNIEEQYNVAFEKCFVPILKFHQDSTDDKTHFLLPSEVNTISSDNETFSDCNDERDPLAATFVEPSSLNVTTDLELYQSAVNNSMSSNFNNTMDNIAEMTLEVEKGGQTEVAEKCPNEHKQPQFEAVDDYEPMDVDMNVTMEMPIVDYKTEANLSSSLNSRTSVNSQKSSETTSPSFPMKTAQNAGFPRSPKAQSEKLFQCLFLEKSDYLASLEAQGKEEQSSNNSNGNCEEPERAEDEVTKRRTFAVVNSTEDLVENMAELSDNPQTFTLGTLDKDQKPTDNRRTFSVNDNENDSTASKAQSEKQFKSPFLEKSDNLANLEAQAKEEQSSNNSNGNLEEPEKAEDEVINRRTFAVVNSIEDQVENIAELRKETQPFSLDTLDKDQNATDKRRTFSVKANENDSNSPMQFPATDKMENACSTETTEKQYDMSLLNENILSTSNTDTNPRRTFNLNEFTTTSSELPLQSETKPRRTFNLNETVTTSAEQTGLDTSLEPMDVDESVSQNTTMSLPEDVESRGQTSPSPAIKQESRSPPKTQSPTPPLTLADQTSQSPTKSIEGKEYTSVSPSPLPTMQSKSQSSPPPYVQTKSQSPLPNIDVKSQSSPPPSVQPKSHSPPLPTMQRKSQSSPPPHVQPMSQSPPLPTRQPREEPSSPLLNSQQNQTTTPEATAQPVDSIKEETISPSTSFESNGISLASQPLSTLIQKRPSIRDARARAADILSAKEQSNIKAKDEKDVVMEKSTPSPIEEVFTAVSATSTTLSNTSQLSEFNQTSPSCSSLVQIEEQQTKTEPTENEFIGNNNLILNPSDFDYLLTKGNNNTPVDRSSLLLKFDPLLGVPVPVNQGQPQLRPLQIPTYTTNPYLSPTLEEEEHNDSNRSFVIDPKPEASAKLLRERAQEVKQHLQLEQQIQQNNQQLTQGVNKKNATMSVDVIKDMSLDNDCNKTYENSNSTQSDDKQINYKMDELEKKIKNEVLKTEDIEKKLKDAEQREEALIKRITEKDKTIAKMTGVIEAYEKAIAELIADKEQLTQNYEKQLAEVKADRDSNYHHLTSLETTFSDLHVKYEKSKEMTCQLKENEEALQAEKRKNLENLHLQEQRYDKMKNHAMQQLEIANKKLESLTREHSIEITKLKALLKKEEIARSSINEQLAHKTKENAELVKICDELISGQGSNFSFEPFDPKKH